MRRAAFVLWAIALLALAVPADAGWTVSGPGSNGGLALPAGDLSGTASTNSNPTISNLTGSANTVTTGATTFTQSGTGPAGAAAASVTWNTQATNATNGTSGQFNVNLPAPTGSGGQGQFCVQQAGVNQFCAGVLETAPGQAAFWMRQATPSITNYTFHGDGSTFSGFNGQNLLQFEVGGVVLGQAVTSGSQPSLQLFTSTASLGGGQGVLGVANATANPNANPTGGGVVYESGGGLFHRGSGGAVDQIGAVGVGTINTQTMKLAGELYAMRTTSNTTTTFATVAVATSTCHQFHIQWMLRTATGTAAAFNETDCFACNNAGTVTTSTAQNVLAATQVIGTPCSVAAPTVTCATSGTNTLLQGLCNTGTVDWQINVTDNND